MNAAAMALVVVLAQAPSPAPVGSVTIGDTSTYRLVLQAGERVVRVSALPRPGSYVFELIADHPPPMTTIAPVTPLRPGTYNIEIKSKVEDPDREDRVFLFSLPALPGRFVFVVTVNGKGRYDFVVTGPVGSPQRTTFMAPQKRYAFRATLARPRKRQVIKTAR
jgi:hypothetical protein